MNVREKQIAGVAQHAHFVLDVERDLKIVAPVAALVAVVRQNGIVEKDFEPVKIRAQPFQDDDVGRDDEKIPGQRGIRLVKFVEITPRDEQRQDFGFARAGRQLQNVARPVFIEHPRRHRAGRIEPEQIELVARLPDFMQPDNRLDGLALGKIIPERRARAVGVFGQVFVFKPPAQQRDGCWRRAGIALGLPVKNLFAHLRHQRWDELFIRRGPHGFVGRKPPLLWNQRRVRRCRKIGMERHGLFLPMQILPES